MLELRKTALLAASVHLLAVATGIAENLCLTRSLWADEFGVVDCDPLGPHFRGIDWIGFATDPSDLCANASYGYQWSISSSAVDSRANVGPLPSDGWLYLWSISDDFSALPFTIAEFGLAGSLLPLAFEPSPTVDWLPELFPDLVFWPPDCTGPPFLAGRIQVQKGTAVEDRSWGRVKALYN